MQEKFNNFDNWHFYDNKKFKRNKKILKWQLGVCLSYTSVLASLEQTSTRQQTKLKQTKSESVGKRNTLSLFAVLYND